MTGFTHANHRSARSPRPTLEGPARDNRIAGPRMGTTRSEPSAPASAGASGRHNEPGPRPASACPAQPPSKAGGASLQGATGPDEARRTTRGHGARQRGTPPATTKAHGQMPSSNGRRVPQTRRARTTRNEPRQENRCQATPAAVRTDLCGPGSEPQSLPDTEQPPSGWTSARPEGTQPLPATKRGRPDGQVSAPQRPPQHTTHSTTHRASTLVNSSQETNDTAHPTAHRASTPVNKSQVVQDTVQATQHTQWAHRCTGAKRPRTPHTRHNAQSGHTGE